MLAGKSKIGRFLIFIGLILLVIFISVDRAENPSYGYLCSGVVVLGMGVLLMWRGQQPPEESMRFRTLRKWREQQKQKKKERKNKQPWEH